jgi:hypothetical protein
LLHRLNLLVVDADNNVTATQTKPPSIGTALDFHDNNTASTIVIQAQLR